MLPDTSGLSLSDDIFNTDENPNDSDISPLAASFPALGLQTPVHPHPPTTPHFVIASSGECEVHTPTTPTPGPVLTDDTGTLTNEGEVPSELSSKLRRASCSRKNFGVNLCRYVFSSEVRATSNVSGSVSKDKLGPLKMGAIRRAVFTMWPLEPSEKEQTEWRKVVVTIDEANRRLKRSKK